LDSLLGLQPRQHASPWITAQAVALATRLPYRQATQLLSGFVGQPLDHRSLYAWVRSAGAELVAEEDKEQEAVFVQGELPPRDPQSREIVLAEVDGTFLRAQREQAPEFEVRLGLLACGKGLESLTAKHRRYRLLERVRYAGVEVVSFGRACSAALGGDRSGLRRASLPAGRGSPGVEPRQAFAALSGRQDSIL
jgi:hypothetical protein